MVRMSYMDPGWTRSSSLTKETASLHGTVLPCGSWSRATTQACRLPSSVMVTFGRSAILGGVPEDAPQPATSMGAKQERSMARNDTAPFRKIAPFMRFGGGGRYAGVALAGRALVVRDDIGCVHKINSLNLPVSTAGVNNARPRRSCRATLGRPLSSLSRGAGKPTRRRRPLNSI